MYLAKTHLNPEHQEILKRVEQYRDKLENNFYLQYSRVDAWRKVLEKFNNRVRDTCKDFAPDSEVEEAAKNKRDHQDGVRLHFKREKQPKKKEKQGLGRRLCMRSINYYQKVDVRRTSTSCMVVMVQVHVPRFNKSR